MHVFDEAIRLVAQPGGGWLGHTHPAYGNMVGPFGGITAAQALQAVMLDPARLGEPTALTVNFCAAMQDGPFTAAARAVRTGRSTQHWFVELQQDGQTVTSATVVTAVRREVWSAVEHRMPAVAPPQELPQVPPPRGVAWLSRYEMRFLEGGFPESWNGAEHPDSTSRLWVRDAEPRELDAAALAALCDVFFPRIWRRRERHTPAGTVSMTVYFHADAALLQRTGHAWLLAQARAQAFRNGFFDQTAQLWSPEGDLLASSHQVVYYKD